MSGVTLFGKSVPAAPIPAGLNSRPDFIGHRILPDTTKEVAKTRVARGFFFDAVNIRRTMMDEKILQRAGCEVCLDHVAIIRGENAENDVECRVWIVSSQSIKRIKAPEQFIATLDVISVRLLEFDPRCNQFSLIVLVHDGARVGCSLKRVGVNSNIDSPGRFIDEHYGQPYAFSMRVPNAFTAIDLLSGDSFHPRRFIEPLLDIRCRCGERRRHLEPVRCNLDVPS